MIAIVFLNCTLKDGTLVVQMRKPFDLWAEGLLVSSSRGDWQNLEREVQPYTAAFLHGPELHIRRIGEIMQQTA